MFAMYSSGLYLYSELLLILIATLRDFGEAALSIKSLSMPKRVKNGTEDSLILDCIYTYDDDEDKLFLVVKWFFNDDPEPIYQWIPELNSRTTSERFQGKINMGFAVNTPNNFTKYRAINLVRPTTDLSGRYTCNVANLRGQSYKEKSLLIYAAPKNISFDLMQTSRHDDKVASTRTHTINTKSLRHNNNNNRQDDTYGTKQTMMALSGEGQSSKQIRGPAGIKCAVTDVFPKPEIEIYRLSSDGKHRTLLRDVNRVEKMSPNRAHNIELSAQLDRILPTHGSNEPYTFECAMVLDLAGENITRTTRLTYFWATSSATTTRVTTTLVSSYYFHCLLLIASIYCLRSRWQSFID